MRLLGEAEHKRQKIKNRARAKISKATSISISKMMEMKITPEEKNALKVNPDKALKREKKIVSVTGYAWIIKLSSEDCDIHIEMSESNDPLAERVIAEIPNTAAYCDFHKKILNDLVSNFNFNSKNEYHFDKNDNGGNPIKLTVSGYLFWDSGHPTNANHGSKKVGSIWEIHPVSKITWN